jgi:transposase
LVRMWQRGISAAAMGAMNQTRHSQPNQQEVPIPFSKRLYKLRWRIESAFNRLKDFRRIATRYDKLARNYLASVCLAADGGFNESGP